MKKKKALRTTPIKVHLEGGIVGRIFGAKLLHCEICGDNDQTHLFASPLTRRVLCMKCAATRANDIECKALCDNVALSHLDIANKIINNEKTKEAK